MINTTCASSIKKLAVVAGMGALVLSYAHADVTLQVEDNINVTAINGAKVKQSPFRALKQKFTLQPGKHVITAKYDRLYDLRGDNHDYLRSGNVTVTADMKDNQTYHLTMPKQPEKYKEARDYAKNPTLAVMLGSQVVAQQQGASSEEGVFANLAGLLGRGSAQESNQQAIAAINTQSNSVQSKAVTPTNPVSPAPTVTKNTSTLDRFMALWLQATPAEREKIRQWAAK